ncbi:uncharacterized protein LOC144562395 [Carex rostrata]
MQTLPIEISVRIFHLLDYQSLATANQVSRRWRVLTSDDSFWYNLFKERWGQVSAEFYAPTEPQTWKDVYIVQHRCDHYGLSLKIIKEGNDYYLIHQGKIERYLGSCQNKNGKEMSQQEEGSAISDRLLFFLGDLETACAKAKRVNF